MRLAFRILIGLLYIIAAIFPFGVYFFTAYNPPSQDRSPLGLFVPATQSNGIVGTPIAYVHLILGKVLIILALLIFFSPLILKFAKKKNWKLSDIKLVGFSALAAFVFWILQFFVFQNESFYQNMVSKYKPESNPDMEGQNGISMMALLLALVLSTAYVLIRLISKKFKNTSSEKTKVLKGAIICLVILWQLSGLFIFYPEIKLLGSTEDTILPTQIVIYKNKIPWFGQLLICGYKPEFYDKEGKSTWDGGGGAREYNFSVFKANPGEKVDYVIEVSCGLIPEGDIRYATFPLFETKIKKKSFVVSELPPKEQYENLLRQNNLELLLISNRVE